MNAISNQTEQCTGSASREPKFRELLNQAYGINGVIDHLRELHKALGVIYEETPEPKNDMKASEPTLVIMLDELPNELSMAHSKIHDMINVIINQLN